MKNNIHYFETGKAITQEDTQKKIGIRCRQIMELASLSLPIIPGFIVDAEVAHTYNDNDLLPEMKKQIKLFESKTEKRFGEVVKPLFLKAVFSPNLQISSYPSIHNIGLTKSTLTAFAERVGQKSALEELHFLLKGVIELEKKIAEAGENEAKVKELTKKTDDIHKSLKKLKESKSDKARDEKDSDTVFALGGDTIPADVFTDAQKQITWILSRMRELIRIENSSDGDINNNETAILVQPMVYGNFGKNSASGDFFTRDVVTGEKQLMGTFFKEAFSETDFGGQDISKLDKVFLEELKKTAEKVEVYYKEIRSIRFTIEEGKLWLVDQRVVNDKSTRADIKLLLDLLKQKVVTEKEVVNAIKPSQLNELLHPVIKPASVKGLVSYKGGIAGAPGAAIGRVYFTTESLVVAYREALKNGESKPKLIICMPATYANDVKAVELASGVISSEGGYSAHASVVARQYGKVSLVKNEMKFGKGTVTIGDTVLKEGDYLSMNVPYYGDPFLYVGKAELIESDPAGSGLLDFIAVVKKFVKSFHVRANADTPRDADLALKFGAEGIGLCRTEHMFFDESRINVFREMILSETVEERKKVLKKLQTMQRDDFYKLLKTMAGKEVTIRFLDPPLHEFLPHTDEESKKYIEYQSKGKKADAKVLTLKEVKERTEDLSEFNPMLGHRGSRLAVTYPEIYEMQMIAVLDAASQLMGEGISVHAEVMLPVIMNENELKLLVYGKKIEGQTFKGLYEVMEEWSAKVEAKLVPDIKFGTMIEIPAAALGAGKLAKYAQFFSFGTNDLTQTTLGLSRDDFNSFMPDYTQLDLLEGNPFKYLDPQVKELIQIAVRRGLMARPDLSRGLCGEHGAVPENIQFCIEAGLNYVSCSPYSIPLANLAIAQYNIKNQIL